MRAAQLLQAAGAELNVLAVVTAQAANLASDIYDYFLGVGLRYMQFIPYIARAKTLFTSVILKTC